MLGARPMPGSNGSRPSEIGQPVTPHALTIASPETCPRGQVATPIPRCYVKKVAGAALSL